MVVNGGPLGEHKGINAPGVALPAAAVTAKDEDDLRFGLDARRRPGRAQLRADAGRLLTPRGGSCARRTPTCRSIAKIERPQALEHLDAILAAVDGVMVARGDLGLECPLEQIPRIQKTIIARARALGRPVIVATQVLESMRTEPRPTRAEVSDAATAVDQGVDAIMLAGETAAGDYPVEAVETLIAIIRDAETVATPAALLGPTSRSSGRPARAAADGFDAFRTVHGRAMCEAAVTLASTGQAEAIVAVTQLRQDRAAAVVAAARAPASSPSRRPTSSRGG